MSSDLDIISSLQRIHRCKKGIRQLYNELTDISKDITFFDPKETVGRAMKRNAARRTAGTVFG